MIVVFHDETGHSTNVSIVDLIQDGKSNYLEGAMCIGTYIIIALAFYVYPDEAVSKAPGVLLAMGQ